MAQSTHENFSRDEAVSPGSDRNFGLVMAGALALLSALNGWHHGRLWPWTTVVAIALLAVAWLRPSALRLFDVPLT